MVLLCQVIMNFSPPVGTKPMSEIEGQAEQRNLMGIRQIQCV